MTIGCRPALEWQKCKAGYALEIRCGSTSKEEIAAWERMQRQAKKIIMFEQYLDEPRPKERPTNREIRYIVAKGKEHETVRLDQGNDDIAFEFARSVPEPGQHKRYHRLLEFVNSYGLPASRQNAPDLRLDSYCDLAGDIMVALNRARIGNALSDGAGVRTLVWGGFRPINARLEHFVDPGTGGVHQTLNMANLTQFLWYQVLLHAEMRTPMAVCQQCYGLYRKRGRRESCSDACKERKRAAKRASAGAPT